MAHTGIGLTLLFPLLLAAACVKSSSTAPVAIPPNVKAFDIPYPNLWKAATGVVKEDFKLPLEVADEKGGFFSTKQVTEQPLGITVRNRLSGRILSENNKSMITLYNQRQVLDGEKWKTLPTDYILEKKVIQAIEDRLKPTPQ